MNGDRRTIAGELAEAAAILALGVGVLIFGEPGPVTLAVVAAATATAVFIAARAFDRHTPRRPE